MLCFFILLHFFTTSFAHTHWFVTDEGRIQAKADTILNMVDPQDLFQFLQQYDRSKEIESLQVQMRTEEASIDRHEKFDDPLIEEKLLKHDEDCSSASKMLASIDLFLPVKSPTVAWSYISHDDNVDVFFPTPNTCPLTECTKHLANNFRLRSFDYLASVVNRRKLFNRYIPDLDAAYINSTSLHILKQFAANFDQLTKNRWAFLTILSNYWAHLGSTGRAVDLLLDAIDFSPREVFHIPALQLALILHSNGYSTDAATILETALLQSGKYAHLYFTLGLTHAASLNFLKAEEALLNCVALDPDYPLAKQYKYSIACHRKLQHALEAQHENLQQTLVKLQLYQENMKKVQNLKKLAAPHIADANSHQLNNLVYEEIVYGPLKGVRCWKEYSGFSRVQLKIDCDIIDYKSYFEQKSKFVAIMPKSVNYDQKEQLSKTLPWKNELQQETPN